MTCQRCNANVLFSTPKGCKECEGKPKPRPAGYFRKRQAERHKDPEKREKYNAYQKEYQRKARAKAKHEKENEV